MKRAMVILMVAAAGCDDTDSKIAALDTARQVSAATLETEALARKLGDAETLTAAKAYTDGQFAKGETAIRLDLEIERAKAAENELAAGAKSYTDTVVGKLPPVKVSHLFADLKGGAPVDLGRHHGQAFGAALIGGKPVDVYRDASLIARASGANCSGDLYLVTPPRMLGRDRYVFGGKLYQVASSSPSRLSSWGRLDGSGNCIQDGVTADYYPLTATGETATAYDPLILYVDDVVESQ